MADIELRGFGWRPAGRTRPTLHDITLRVPHGQRVLLLGPSGSGKSTLLQALAGLLPEDSGTLTGEVLIDGADTRRRRDRVSMVFQDPQAQLVMARAGDDVAFGLENRGHDAAAIWPRVDAVLSTVGFPYSVDADTTALSGGEQQRLALAGALATEPSLLLLDEPTANLDPPGAAAVRRGLREALRGGDTTMILVEHRVAECLDLVDRVIALSGDGDVLADGDPRTVFDAHGARLSDIGVWLPTAPPVPVRRAKAPAETALRAEGLRVRYPDAEGEALRGVDLTVRRGELTAVEGHNGSGKSTLALTLGGLIAPQDGRVRVTAGPSAPPHRWRARTLARHLGSVFQLPEQQFVTPRVTDELALGPRAAKLPEREVRRTVERLLPRLRLEHLAEANPFTLSGGEARRLSVATALSRAAEVLILDEPTFGQDRRTWTELIDLLAELRDEGHGIVIVTHDSAAADALADHRVAMAGGRRC